MDLSEGLIVGPTDILIIRVSPSVPQSAMADLRQRLKELQPELAARTVVIGCEQIAVAQVG